jgi:hypothetical protein
MVKLPLWDTPDRRLAREFCPLYAVVNRVHWSINGIDRRLFCYRVFGASAS